MMQGQLCQEQEQSHNVFFLNYVSNLQASHT